MTHKQSTPIDESGNIFWRLDGVVHRDDGPAIEKMSGTKYWFIHGKLHRENAPAIEYANGDKEWWIHGQLHREDGPAIENANSRGDEWWFKGIQYTEIEFPLVKLQDKLNSDLDDNKLIQKKPKI